jgi:ABC-type nitrate/sulfonate/bicarbonate transport system substrate-binding protein
MSDRISILAILSRWENSAPGWRGRHPDGARTPLFSDLSQVLILALLLALLAACAPQQAEVPPDEVTVKLKWVHQAQFAGMYVAAEKGFYEEQDLKVNLVPFTFEEPTMEAVVEGQATFGVKSASEIIQARAEGLPVKAFAVIYKDSPLCMYSLKESGITKPQDLVGKTVGLKPGQITIAYLIMLKRLGLDRDKIAEVQIGYGVEELISGTTDVSTGFSINEPHQAIEAGYDVNIMLFADYGVRVYDDVLFATEDTIDNRPELVERFLRATIEGWQYAIQNEEEAVGIVLEYATDRTRSHEAYMLRQSIPLIHTGGSPIGWMEMDRWQHTHDIVLESGAIDKAIHADEAFTTQFIEEIYAQTE